MTERLDLKGIVVAVEQLEQTVPARKLTVLKDLAFQNGGRWDLPSERSGVYDPIIKSVELFGVYAMAEEVEELPKNWVHAACNILLAEEAEATAPKSTAPPALGTTVRFQRSPTHHPETGIVRGRQFGSGIVEVEDTDTVIHRLQPGNYEVIQNANT